MTGSGAASPANGPAPKVGDRVAVSVRSIGAGGAGIGHLPDGRVVFVHRTAPGDRVEIELTRVKKRWAKARLIQILEEGPDRRPPPVPS
jgi:23S rRNA (uracil1939-C5)-methyltransferase